MDAEGRRRQHRRVRPAPTASPSSTRRTRAGASRSSTRSRSSATKPITTIINTHTHGDHVSGNVEFPATVEVIVQENTKANMQEMRGATGIAAERPADRTSSRQNNGRGMPTQDVQGQDDDRQGRRRDRPVSTSAAATRTATRGSCSRRCGSCTPATSSRARTSRCSTRTTAAAAWQIGDTLAKAAKSLKNIDTVITGHSTTMTMADLREYAEFNKEFMTRRAGGEEGRQDRGRHRPPAGRSRRSTRATRTRRARRSRPRVSRPTCRSCSTRRSRFQGSRFHGSRFGF